MASFTKESLFKSYRSLYKKEPESFFDCGGRFEVLGNHTDHNHGLCIVATCDLTIGAAVSKDKKIHVVSKGNSDVDFSIDNLECLKDEIGSSKAIIKGVLFYLQKHGYKIGGFNAYIESDILPGGGVSSSAAFELLIAQIQNELYNENKIAKLLLCQAGQYAENVYFGKNSGLLDQIGVGYGGFNFIDFGDIAHPVVETLPLPFKDLHFVLVNSGGSHADLTEQYASIPNSMFEVAENYGAKFLRDINENEFEVDVAKKEYEFDELDKKRAEHFFEENKRVKSAVKALRDGDESIFLDMINQSQDSSQNKLCNTQVDDQYAGSPQEAIDYAYALIGGGACKINGGGFAGTIICFVKDADFSFFSKKMIERYGEKNVIEIHVRKDGPHSH